MSASSIKSVLHVEDSPTDALLTRAELERSQLFRLTQVDRLEAALRVLASEHITVVLLDLGLPDSQGLETLRRIQRAAPNVPVVVMTGNTDEDLAVLAVQEGAQDYLVKNQTHEFLLDRTLRYAIERNLARQRLCEREELFRGAFENTSVATVLTDMNHRFVRVNDAFAQLFGYTLQEMLALSMPDITHPEDLAESYALRERLLRGESSFFQTEKRYRHKLGHLLWGLTNVSLVRDANAKPLLYVGQVQDITERKHAEEALRIAEARNAAILEAALDAIISMDSSGKIIGFNPAAERIFGYRKAEAIGQSLAELIIPRPLRQLHCNGLARYDAGGLSIALNQRLEMPALRKDGGEFPVELTITSISSQGSYIFTAFLRDLTERKRAEQRHAAQHAVVRVLATASSIQAAVEQILEIVCTTLDWDLGAFWQAEKASGLLHCVWTWHPPASPFVSFAAESKRFPYPPDTGQPGTVWSTRKAIWYTDYARETDFPRGMAFKLGLHGSFGVAVTLGDNILGVLEFFSKDLREPDNDLLTMMTSIGSQIGQFIRRVWAAEELQAAQLRLSHVVSTSPAVLLTVGIEEEQLRGISWMSDNVRDMLGYPVSETSGADWWMKYVHQDDVKPIVNNVQRDIFNKGFASYEFRFQHKNGRFRWIRSELRLLRDAGGKPVEVVGSWSDITDRMQLEQQFQQAQKMEAVGQLAGGVAHDFNNLLTIISGYSEIMLSMLRANDPMRKSVKAISEAGERAASLTRQLLAFSRKTVLEPKVLDLNEVVRESEKLLRRLIGEDILLTAVLDPTIGRVKVDPGQFGQVLMNLAVNARDAMTKGGKLTLETRHVELDEGYTRLHPDLKAGWYVLLSVSDTGSGMQPEIKARIFEPFFTTKGVGKGTGLGLAVVLGVVKQSGGHVEVYTEPDIGTTFKIYLPAVSEKASDSKLIEGGKSGLGTETVLLVEDEDGVRGLALLVLQNYGYKVIAARNGKEAQRIVANHRAGIDLLVTDVVMPGMSGPELADFLLPNLPKMKVLYCSGYTDDAVLRHGLLQEKVAFLQKPYSPLVLARKVRQVLDEK